MPSPDHPTPERSIEFADNLLLIDLCGQHDSNLAAIEKGFDIHILRRGNILTLIGQEDQTARAADMLRAAYDRLSQGKPLQQGDIDRYFQVGGQANQQLEMFRGGKVELRTRKKSVEPRTATQKAYVDSLFANELAVGMGPAGTGKTYLAVAVGVSMFLDGAVDRIILSRPAVEAGEKLGYLPGDMKDKVDPYMQPLYDALNDFLPGKQLAKLVEDKRIEIAPLAFMRGRTLSNAFVVLDEAQNATTMQMKMFLTRLGEGSRMVITGDATQIDLPRNVPSGLIEAEKLLTDIDGIGFTYFTASDVVRHPLVAKIIKAYDKNA